MTMSMDHMLGRPSFQVMGSECSLLVDPRRNNPQQKLQIPLKPTQPKAAKVEKHGGGSISALKGAGMKMKQRGSNAMAMSSQQKRN